MDKTFIRFFGIRRSGNHALHNWIIPKFSGRIYYKNNADVTAKVKVKNCNDLNCFNPKHNYTHISRATIDDNDVMFVAYEDKDFLKTLSIPPNLDDVYGPYNKYLDIFVVRSPYNLFCSKARHYDSGQAVRHDLCVHKRKNFKKLVSLWKDMAARLLNPQEGEVGIYYDRWYADEDYRKLICQELGVEFNDKGKHLVSNNGGGSSFDQLTKKPEEMNVLNRTEGYEEYEFYLKLLEDATLNELHNEIKESFSSQILLKSVKEGKSPPLEWPCNGFS